MSTDAHQLIRETYPINIRSNFVPMITRAYAAVEELIVDKDILNWEVGKNLRGYLRNIAVEFEFKRMISNGLLPLEYRISNNSRKNHRHIEILTENTILTISQLKNKNSVPRRANFRVNLSYNNQIMMDFGKTDIELIDSPSYLLITHGGENNNLDFIRLGLPAPYVGKWIDYIDLMDELKLVDYGDPLIEDEETIVKLKDGLKQEVLKNG